MIPGSNLLALAMGPIARQSVQWRAWVSRTENAIGNFVTVYADPVTISGSFQPVPRKRYTQLGLDLEKEYANFYAPFDVRALDRDRSGDLLIYGGRTWQIVEDEDWFDQDGWRKLLCIEVPGP